MQWMVSTTKRTKNMIIPTLKPVCLSSSVLALAKQSATQGRVSVTPRAYVASCIPKGKRPVYFPHHHVASFQGLRWEGRGWDFVFASPRPIPLSERTSAIYLHPTISTAEASLGATARYSLRESSMNKAPRKLLAHSSGDRMCYARNGRFKSTLIAWLIGMD